MSVHDLSTGAKVADLDLPLGSVSGLTGRKRDSLAFVQFTSFLTPGTVFKCDLTEQPPKLEVCEYGRGWVSYVVVSQPPCAPCVMHAMYEEASQTICLGRGSPTQRIDLTLFPHQDAFASGSSHTIQVFREAKLNDVDLSGFTVRQVFYESKDKTRIPMFIVGPKELKLDGTYPCQLYGYGGFDIAITPSFSVSRLLLLMNFGGIVAIANIRGGGEYGKRWHDAGRRKLKQNCFDDFQAAAEYLIAGQYTCRDKLYIVGGSNGGLLVCTCCNQRPDLFGAAIAQVPVCDLLRFHKFTIGHAWVSDYGDPDTEEDFRVLLKYSPLHNVRVPNDPKTRYPALMILTADHDDRVVPLHAFKFISTLQASMGERNNPNDRPLLARIETKAGHGAGKPTSKMVRTCVCVSHRLAFDKDIRDKLIVKQIHW
ncbi:unnamed protein product [Echinostoma caproni]|uniref:Prolyl endopeptidase n=1 Tax=Echinostoma caproni TaxID=27848 RepID=A0A3P8GQV1_9TREM|nr:unnamed protein product [Echinostoma caproni]